MKILKNIGEIIPGLAISIVIAVIAKAIESLLPHTHHRRIGNCTFYRNDYKPFLET